MARAAAMLAWVGACVAVGTGGPGCAGLGGRLGACPDPDPDGWTTRATPSPQTLVLVHSATGRTLTAGSEIAAMLGARCVQFADPPAVPFGAARPGAPMLSDLLPSLRRQEFRELYLGFPIWAGAPSPQAFEAVAALRLAGVRVIPFYTFIHSSDERALGSLARAVADAGGTPVAPLGFRLPLTWPDGAIRQSVGRAVLARPDLWGDAEGPPGASCRPGQGAGDETWCHIPAGIVWVGRTSDGAAEGSGPPRRVRLPAFEIMKNEATRGRYAACQRAGPCLPEGDRRALTTAAPAAPEDMLPADWVPVDGAVAFCTWAGARLPTEAEWMRAGRGATLLAYPWGDEPPGGSRPARANLGEQPGSGSPGYEMVPADRAWESDGHPGTSPVCSMPDGDSPFGVCDLAGNVAEWVAGPGDRAGVAPFQGVKGGSWIDEDVSAVRLDATGRVHRSMGYYLTGVRCVRDVR